MLQRVACILHVSRLTPPPLPSPLFLAPGLKSFLSLRSSHRQRWNKCLISIICYSTTFIRANRYEENVTIFLFFFFLEQTQFVVIVTYIINALRIDCGYSRNHLYIAWVYCITLIILFSKFYIQSYINKSDSNDNNNNQKKSEWMTWHILLVSSCIKVWWENQLPFIWVQVVVIVTRYRQRKIGVCFLVKSQFFWNW